MNEMNLPTDEELIELLRKIKEHCASRKKCVGCEFYLKHNAGCQIVALLHALSTYPHDWPMGEIERIIML